jgi:hypothetical protein
MECVPASPAPQAQRKLAPRFNVGSAAKTRPESQRDGAILLKHNLSRAACNPLLTCGLSSVTLFKSNRSSFDFKGARNAPFVAQEASAG